MKDGTPIILYTKETRVAQSKTETTCSCSSRARASLLALLSHVTPGS
jgi:hypothetical protein